jgi:hypothetical protein
VVASEVRERQANRNRYRLVIFNVFFQVLGQRLFYTPHKSLFPPPKVRQRALLSTDHFDFLE